MIVYRLDSNRYSRSMVQKCTVVLGKSYPYNFTISELDNSWLIEARSDFDGGNGQHDFRSMCDFTSGYFACIEANSW